MPGTAQRSRPSPCSVRPPVTTLISPTVFLTAAHCDWGIPRLAVTFDSVYDAETGKEYWGTWRADPQYTGRRATRTTSRSSSSTSP